MSKSRVPLMSLEARGSLADSVSFRRSRHVNVAEKKPEPANPKTPGQVSWRTMFEKCSLLWHTLSAAEKAVWETLARSRHMTGYALWQSQCLRPNPGVYLPLAGGTMQGDIDMDFNGVTNMSDPAGAQDADTKAARDAAITAALATPGCRVYSSVNISIPNSATTFINFDGERYDNDNIHETVTHPERLTCQHAGKYLVFATIRFDTNAAGLRAVRPSWNGSTQIADHSELPPAAAACRIAVATVWELAVGDYVRCGVFQDCGGYLNVVVLTNSSPEFGIQKIG